MKTTWWITSLLRYTCSRLTGWESPRLHFRPSLQVATQLGLAPPDSSLDSSHDPDAAASLVGSHYLQLLHYIPQPSLPAFASLLSSLLATELGEVQRGVVYSALRRCQAPSQLERTLDGVLRKLRGICGVVHNRDGPTGLIAGRLASELH